MTTSSGSWPLLLPLCAALLYVTAVLSLKRAAELGAGLWQSTVVTNLSAAIAFQVLLVFGGTWLPWRFWWQPLIVAVLFLLGQGLTLFSLQKGDVSIATPVLGLKIVLVACFTTVLTAQTISWQLWTAAALATLGIAALNHPGAHKIGANARSTVVSAGLAAASFALFDVLVQKWSPAWGPGRLMPIAMAYLGIISLSLHCLFGRPAERLAPAAWRWLGMGSVFFAMQTVVFVSSIAHFGNATSMNVVYSSRGLWSILAVALLGHWFHSNERKLGPTILRWRFAGAALMFAALVLLLA